MKELSKRQKQLEKIINEIDDNYGIGAGYISANTDVLELSIGKRQR